MQTAATSQHPVDDGLAVLRFTDLKVGRLGRGLDEVSRGVDAEQPRRLAADLTAQDDAGVEVQPEFLQLPGIALVDFAHGIPDAARRFEQVGSRKQVRATVSRLYV